MNPTPDQVAKIEAFVATLPGQWSNADPQIRAAMQAQTQPNPVATAPAVPKPFDVDDLTAALGVGNTSVDTLATTIPSFLDDVDNRRLASLRRWGRLLRRLGKVTATEATALAAIVNATVPDPSWTATVTWDVANLGRPADDHDIEAARVSAEA
jgi:hypothetical protein